MAAFTFLSRITGLARDISFSTWFGAGPVMDAFAVAFKIPNLLRRFFGEGAFSQAFVPVISEYRATRSPAETRDLIDRTTGTLALVLFAITLVGVIAAPLVILVFAPGFLDDAGRFPLTVADAAAHVPVHLLRVAHGARRQHLERAPAVCGRRVHARAAERRDDRIRGLGRAAAALARRRARVGRVRGRRRAAVRFSCRS